MKRKKRQFNIGDLVEYYDEFEEKTIKGVILGTPDDWWVINKHYDVKGTIVHYKKIKLVKKGFIKKYQLKWVLH